MLRVAPALVVFAALALASGCDCSGTPITSCSASTDCRGGAICVDGVCREPADGAVPDAGEGCDDGRAMCGFVCCASDRACTDGVCRLDCGGADSCGGACCATGLE